MFLTDLLTQNLYQAICQIPLIDPHSHIDAYRPTARSLDDLLGYHYYTELAHSAGMSQAPLAASVDPRERCRAILGHITARSGLIRARGGLGWAPSGSRMVAWDHLPLTGPLAGSHLLLAGTSRRGEAWGRLVRSPPPARGFGHLGGHLETSRCPI